MPFKDISSNKPMFRNKNTGENYGTGIGHFNIFVSFVRLYYNKQFMNVITLNIGTFYGRIPLIGTIKNCKIDNIG
jgi:hypothetical protein